MAISIDFPSKVISVPQADMDLVSGTFYRLPTETTFRADVNALMADETGIVFDDSINHNTDITIAGVTYARFIEVINGYAVQMTPDSQFTVELTESNNNLHDVAAGALVQNQVQVLTTNSAGLISVTSGSGLDAGQDSKITRIHEMLDIIEGGLDHQEAMRIMLAALAGKALGMETANGIFRNTLDTKDRITVVTDEDGNRLSVTFDLT